MKSDRRSFLRLTALVVCATATAPGVAFGETARRAGLEKAGRAVLDFTRRYASHVRVVRDLADTTAGTRLLVRVDNLARFARMLPAIPFENVRAQGNCVSFAVNGRNFTIENVTPDVFASRVAELKHSATAAIA
jgi:hypothetical protein